MRRFVDRGDPLQGIERTARDSRVPYSLARNMENFSLPDSKAKRRPGFEEVASDPVRGQMLAKSRGSHISSAVRPSANAKDDHYITPLSYGLIRDQADLKLHVADDWTLEFYVRLGALEPLVVEPYIRRAKKTGGTVQWDFQTRVEGVYLLDRTILSNNHLFDPGTIASPDGDKQMPADLSGADKHYDALPLTTIAISYKHDSIDLQMGIVEYTGANQGRYWPNEVRLTYGITAAEGDFHHIAVRHTASTGVIDLVVDGATRDSWTNPDTAVYGFIGEYDEINGRTWATGTQVDTVLLNECTVRGSYASACKIQEEMHGHQTFSQDYTTDPTQKAAPLACSPPRGTAIRDLRFWGESRGDVTILANMTTKIITGSNLSAAWTFDGGGSVEFDQVGRLPCTIHHGIPSYVTHPSLLHSNGLIFADGQHIKWTSEEQDYLFRQDASAVFIEALKYWPEPEDKVFEQWRRCQTAHDITVQMQVIASDGLQAELNDAETGGTLQTRELVSTGPTANSETRRSMSGAAAFNDMSLYRRKDGGPSVDAVANIHDSVGEDFPAVVEFPRAYDQTLFSIEKSAETSNDPTGFAQRWKTPVFRGLVNPSGKVVLEALLDGGDGVSSSSAQPRYIRIVSLTPVVPGTAFTLTFVKRATYSAHSDEAPSGVQFEIWVAPTGVTPSGPDVAHKIEQEDAISFTWTTASPAKVNWTLPSHLAAGEKVQLEVSGATSAPGNVNNAAYGVVVAGGLELYDSNGAPIDASTSASGGTINIENELKTSVPRTGNGVDVVVGASSVRHGWDRSVSAPNGNTYVSAANWDPVGGSISGPWEVPQQFMSPYEDQPGFFTLGFFRLWQAALTKADIIRFGEAEVEESDQNEDLVFNVEIEGVTGRRIPSRSVYSASFELGFKGWGTPQQHENDAIVYDRAGGGDENLHHLYAPSVRNVQAMEDRLGYIALRPISPATYSTDALEECRGLAPFQTTLTQRFGLLGVWGDSILLNEELNNTLEQLHINRSGILSDYVPGKRWRGLSVGDRTILTSNGGRPKVYNGSYAVPAGLNQGKLPAPVLREAMATSGAGLDAGWYGVTIVYFAEKGALEQFTERALIRLENDNSSIEVIGTNGHPDPRVTSWTVYRTLKQDLRQTAAVAPQFAIPANFPVGYIEIESVQQVDSSLTTAALIDEATSLPDCRFAAEMNGRVYLAGDHLVPDAVYYSYPGNPEQFDTVAQVFNVIGGGSGITGMVAIYGVLFVFKANSIHRVEEIQAGNHQVVKVEDIGAVSEDSITVFTDPDTGRTFIFFWSQHGPYVYDGTALQYVGRPIENDDVSGPLTDEFTWLDPTTVLVLPDIRNRELICTYRPKLGDSVYKHRSNAVVFNTRFRSWYPYSGMMMSAALSQSFSGDAISSLNPTVIGASQSDVTAIYGAYFGSPNGRLYKWGSVEEDGLPDGDTATGPFPVLSYSSGVLTLSGPSLSAGSYTHLWITVVRPSNGEFFSVPVRDNTIDTVTIDSDWESYLGSLPFEPDVGDDVYVCLPPAFIEFPWDAILVPFFDKELIELVTWHDKQFYMKAWRDWDKTNVLEYWKRLADAGHKRNLTNIPAGAVEAFKLKLTSFEKQASLDAFGYTVDVRGDATLDQ